MLFKNIQIKHFRNLTSLKTDFSEGVNIFVGLNGQGKTNLLETLFLLSQGDSFRFGDNSALIQKGSNESFIKCLAVENKLEFDVTLHILKSRKNFLLQGKKTTATEIQQKFPAVIFSPESLSAIKEGADFRRQLIDQLIVLIDPKNSQLIADFRKALKTRNRILRDALDPKVPIRQTEELLESINPSFLRLATQLTSARTKAIKEIQADFRTAYRGISSQNVDISVEYVISSQKALDFDQESVRLLLQKRLEELHSAELSSGASLVGPQKHDISFIYDGNDSRIFCSQGQQRALILAFKMAQIVYHRRVHKSYPVLMLDDVLSELDFEKKNALLHFLQDIRTQIFITTTDLDFSTSLESKRPAIFKIADGQIVERV